jgi:PAS domain-containing protein
LRLKHSQDLVCAVAFDGHLIEFNSVFHSKLGYSTEELLLKSFISIFLSEENDPIERVSGIVVDPLQMNLMVN